MNIQINNAEEAEMPETMVKNCQVLLERRIKKEFPDALPEPETEITILYSDEDPAGEAHEGDDTAYFLYFTVEKVDSEAEGDPDKASIELALMF